MYLVHKVPLSLSLRGIHSIRTLNGVCFHMYPSNSGCGHRDNDKMTRHSVCLHDLLAWGWSQTGLFWFDNCFSGPFTDETNKNNWIVFSHWFAWYTVISWDCMQCGYGCQRPDFISQTYGKFLLNVGHKNSIEIMIKLFGAVIYYMIMSSMLYIVVWLPMMCWKWSIKMCSVGFIPKCISLILSISTSRIVLSWVKYFVPSISYKQYPYCFPPHTTKLLWGYIGFIPSVHPSVRPSVRQSVLPLCCAYSPGWIHFISIHLIKQLQQVCHVYSFL